MKIILRTALFLLVLAGGAHATAQGSLVGEDAFTKLYVEALRGQAPQLEVRVAGPMELVIGHDGQDMTAYLDNAYARYRSAPELLDETIADYVQATLETVFRDAAGIDVTRIVPVIKNASYLDEIRQGLEDSDAAEIAHERYNEHLTILYAEDTPHNIRYLNDLDVDDLGIDRAGLRAMAVANLDSLMPATEAHGSDGTYMLVADGNYEASLLLFDDIWTDDMWRTGSLPVTGELVIAVPARDLLLVTGSRDARGLAVIREAARDIVATDPYSITDQLFVYRDGRFLPFDG